MDEVAERTASDFELSRERARVARARLAPDQVLIVKPLTMMNLSGEAVGAIARYYRIAMADLLVVADDAALPLGRLRARARGSSGGHNGFKSVAQHLGTDDWARLRLGVGRGDAGTGDLADHVLATFEPDERPVATEMIQRAADAVQVFIGEGIDAVMRRFNAPMEERSETEDTTTNGQP
jgi:PTH1 family peptidyl-tRNA hydrolase